ASRARLRCVRRGALPGGGRDVSPLVGPLTAVRCGHTSRPETPPTGYALGGRWRGGQVPAGGPPALAGRERGGRHPSSCRRGRGAPALLRFVWSPLFSGRDSQVPGADPAGR